MERTKGTWGPYGSPDKRWEPTRGSMEAAPGLTIGSTDNTEPICRVSGYLQPLEANADFICTAVNYHERLVEQVRALEWSGVVELYGGGIGSTRVCPFCRQGDPTMLKVYPRRGYDKEDFGHKDTCKLGTLLEELEG